MPQQNTWENEYKNPQLTQDSEEPREDVKKFLKYLRREQNISLENLHILDLGCGTGKHTNYLAELGAHATGIDISSRAIAIARNRALKKGYIVDYHVANIGASLTFIDNSFGLMLDVMCSNSLNEDERMIYLEETFRLLSPDGHFFVRILAKDGDRHAKNLLKLHPGKEKDTYMNTDMNLIERVFSREDFCELYGKFFKINELIKKTNYATFKNQPYKRNYWIAYLQKK